MASIQKRPTGFQAQFRRTGYRPISKYFLPHMKLRLGCGRSNPKSTRGSTKLIVAQKPRLF